VEDESYGKEVQRRVAWAGDPVGVELRRDPATAVGAIERVHRRAAGRLRNEELIADGGRANGRATFSPCCVRPWTPADLHQVTVAVVQ
jgi:hypothetical protein